MISRKAIVTEAQYRKRRKGIVYRKIFITYEDGSRETFLVPPKEDVNE